MNSIMQFNVNCTKGVYAVDTYAETVCCEAIFSMKNEIFFAKNFVFTDDFYQHLNISSNEELSELLRNLEDDMIYDQDILSEQDLNKLCADIDFDENIFEDSSLTPSTPSHQEQNHPEWGIPVSNIILGDELDLNNIKDDSIADILHRPSSPIHIQHQLPTFEMHVDPELQEILNTPMKLHPQEINNYMDRFCESDIVQEIEKVRIM